jgi:hypothetical protein
MQRPFVNDLLLQNPYHKRPFIIEQHITTPKNGFHD